MILTVAIQIHRCSLRKSCGQAQTWFAVCCALILLCAASTARAQQCGDYVTWKGQTAQQPMQHQLPAKQSSPLAPKLPCPCQGMSCHGTPLQAPAPVAPSSSRDSSPLAILSAANEPNDFDSQAAFAALRCEVADGYLPTIDRPPKFFS